MEMAYGRRCVLVAGLLALSACTSPPSTPDPTPGLPSSPAAAASSAPPASVLATTPARSAGLVIERTGGFVGVDQTITVEPDGRWTYYRSRAGEGGGTPMRGRLNDVHLEDLRALLADPTLGREVGKTSDCADGFVYTLVTGPTKVRWADCGTGAPPTAMRVLQLIEMSTPF